MGKAACRGAGRASDRALANTTSLTFPGVEAEALLLLLDQAGVCASAGSACLVDSDEPSHVIRAMKPEGAADDPVFAGDRNRRDRGGRGGGRGGRASATLTPLASGRASFMVAGMATVSSRQKTKPRGKGRKSPSKAAYQLVKDPATGLVITQGPSDVPLVTSEQVKALLANFP